MLTAQKPLWKEFERLSLEIVTAPLNATARMTTLSNRPTLCDRIKSHQKGDQSLEFIKVGEMEHEEEETHKLEEGTQEELGEDARGVDFQIPTGPITRAQSKRLQEALQGLVGCTLEEETKSKASSKKLGLQKETKIINLIQVQSSEGPITLG
ncbi:Hypothetical predicted protein [Olea europaea subsp. europaea]|uniref:Uncharacterized protein n=1 Tax=Olea europaea subsp. europaea TaxID=158383 RepID=A0A8S0UDH2_OLEEU|nr:Hypothetical predicted protein [Olea europaea subsp. europaea]